MTDDAPRLDWTFEVDVPVDSDLHEVVRRTLDERPASRRPVHRAVLGAVSRILGRPVGLSGLVHGDEIGVAEVHVVLPRGPRRAVGLVAAAVPSRWRWRSEGESLVGRGPREVRPVESRLAVPDRTVSLAFAFPDDLEQLVHHLLPAPVRGLRRGEIHLRDVCSREAEVRWKLRFDDAERAVAASEAIDALLARIFQDHGAHGLRYDGTWTRDGAVAAGMYRAIATPDWTTVVGRLIDGRPGSSSATAVDGEPGERWPTSPSSTET